MLSLSGKGLIAIEWSLIGIAFLLGLARLDLRLHHRQQGFVVRDLFYCCALSAGLANTAIDTSLWRRGIGIYEEDVDFGLIQWEAPEDVKVSVYKTIYIALFTFYLQQYLTKGTLITLYFELFGHRSPKTRIALYILTVFCATGFITTIFMLLFACRFGCFWSLEDECRDQSCQIVKDNLAWAFHFISDVAIFILPIVCISRLPMSRTQKISAALTFCLGFVNVCITIIRWFIVHAPFSPSTTFAVDQALFITDAHTCLIISILPSLRVYLRIFRGENIRPRDPGAEKALSPSQAGKGSTTHHETPHTSANKSFSQHQSLLNH